MTMAPDTTAYIGQPHRRQNALRHLAGRGRFTTDLVLPRMVHAAFVRSPVARGQILAVDVEQASQAPGVICVLTAADLNPLCTPWVGTLDHFARMASPPQNILAETHVVWAGQPLVMVIASSRAQAEDACELVVVEIEDQEPVVDGAAALAPGADTASPGLASNLCYETVLETADVDAAFAKAACVVDGEFSFGRHTAVTLEPRAVVADFDPSTGQLTVHQGTQTPYQFQDVYARHFGLNEGQVRVIAADVGGSFGMKLHVYHEEMATVAASKMLGRPVRFVADRLESFLSDIHARDHKVRARMAVDANGIITAMEVDDLTQIGAFSAYPRTSAAEGNQVIRLMGGPYRMQDYRGRLSVVFQNKVQTSQYRAVGHPIACAVTEVLVDRVAEALGQDPLDLRGRNVVPDDAYPHTSATGYQFEKLSHQACLARLRQMMGYETLRAEQAMLRKTGTYRGIGIAPFIEITNPGAAFYGVGGARISAQDGAIVKLTPSGDVQCMISVTEQGQGTETIIAQIVGEQLGVSPERVKVITGDTDTTPVGGATWACRGAGIGGESGFPFAFTNGVQASHVEVDVETGLVKLLKHWVVEDCGRIINPLLVDEQIRGGVVQGLGAALFEECLYDEAGQLTNGSLAEYLVPMACEMPDIVIGHVETPTLDTILGAKGVGEAGTAAAGAAAMNAVNDALMPFKARLMQTPMTPARILAALGHV